MLVYAILTVPVAIAAGLLIALHAKKEETVVYGALDKVGRVTNVVLIPAYACMVPFTMLLGMVSMPMQDGLMGCVGWIVSILIASAALFCGIGLGLSVAWRKRGKKIASFIIQFAGVFGILLSFVLYATCVGSLIRPLN